MDVNNPGLIPSTLTTCIISYKHWFPPIAAAEGTYNVFLPEGILGVVQQEFFGHIRAVQPDSTTEIQSYRNITQLLCKYIIIITAAIIKKIKDWGCISFTPDHIFKSSLPELQFSLQCWSFQSFHVVWGSKERNKNGWNPAVVPYKTGLTVNEQIRRFNTIEVIMLATCSGLTFVTMGEEICPGM